LAESHGLSFLSVCFLSFVRIEILLLLRSPFVLPLFETIVSSGVCRRIEGGAPSGFVPALRCSGGLGRAPPLGLRDARVPDPEIHGEAPPWSLRSTAKRLRLLLCRGLSAAAGSVSAPRSYCWLWAASVSFWSGSSSMLPEAGRPSRRSDPEIHGGDAPPEAGRPSPPSAAA
jgi:hypothetical protein